MFLKSKRFLSLFLCAVLTLAAFSPVFGEISSESTGTKFYSDIDTEKVIAFLQQPAGDTGYCNGEILRITRGLPPVYNGEFNDSFFVVYPAHLPIPPHRILWGPPVSKSRAFTKTAFCIGIVMILSIFTVSLTFPAQP